MIPRRTRVFIRLSKGHLWLHTAISWLWGPWCSDTSGTVLNCTLLFWSYLSPEIFRLLWSIGIFWLSLSNCSSSQRPRSDLSFAVEHTVQLHLLCFLAAEGRWGLPPAQHPHLASPLNALFFVSWKNSLLRWFSCIDRFEVLGYIPFKWQ